MTSRSALPLLLLPPSEGKATGGDEPWDPDDGAFGSLGDERRAVADALASAGGGDGKLLGVSGDRLTRAQSANCTVRGAPSLPAWRRYTGVVWNHLDPATLGDRERRRIVVFSGLLGLVRGDDPVPDYRLRMGVSLPPLGKLSTWWRPHVTAEVAGTAGRRPVVDLLPREHGAAWTAEGVRGLRIELIDPTGKPGGHFAKAAKGRLARAILLDGLDALDDWTDDRFEAVVTPLR